VLIETIRGNRFRSNSSSGIVVEMALELPKALQVECKEAKRLNGRYLLLSELHNDSPVWGVGAEGPRLFRTKKGSWMLTHASRYMAKDSGIACSATPNPAMPWLLRKWRAKARGVEPWAPAPGLSVLVHGFRGHQNKQQKETSLRVWGRCEPGPEAAQAFLQKNMLALCKIAEKDGLEAAQQILLERGVEQRFTKLLRIHKMEDGDEELFQNGNPYGQETGGPEEEEGDEPLDFGASAWQPQMIKKGQRRKFQTLCC